MAYAASGLILLGEAEEVISRNRGQLLPISTAEKKTCTAGSGLGRAEGKRFRAAELCEAPKQAGCARTPGTEQRPPMGETGPTQAAVP